MAEIQHWLSAAHEQFKPSELLKQAVAAERAGFDAVAPSSTWSASARWSSWAQTSWC
jgi:alkanesulfonate monooxygenase SsuD/methylene tetrahydromethanopterin reductase-like flavin-dependent oxidoreductase (luciferase family)